MRSTWILEVHLAREPALIVRRSHLSAINIADHFLWLELNQRQGLAIVGGDVVHLARVGGRRIVGVLRQIEAIYLFLI